MKLLSAISKQVFGAKYERIRKSLLPCFIIFAALYAAEIKVTIAPFILFLTATFLSFGVMWQAIGSGQNAEMLKGLLMLPFDNKEFIRSYLLVLGGYTFIIKTLPVLTVFGAVKRWSAGQIVMAVLCACNGCAVAAVCHSFIKKKHIVLAALWGGSVFLSVFFIRRLSLLYGIVAVSILGAVLYLPTVDAYLFYRPVSARRLTKGGRRKGSILLYLLRYLFTNKNYMMNTAGLWAIACFLPFLFGQIEGINLLPLGLAGLCLNTPVCILLSCDPDLEQAVRALPGQVTGFCSRYCMFLFAVNMTADSIYLISWQLQNGGVRGADILTAVLFALQSAILSVLLEWFYPIRNWKIENDLWHHPRKYVVPLLMMLLAVMIGTYPVLVWVWLCIVLCQCCSLLLIGRRM